MRNILAEGLGRGLQFIDRFTRKAVPPPPRHTPTNWGVSFTQLNHGWNADPNGAEISAQIRGTSLIVQVPPNAYQFKDYAGVPLITLEFTHCAQYRITPVNDHGYALGQCRFSGLAPAWGEFYEITGDTRDALDPTPWQNGAGTGQRHFHFFMRDETLEVKAAGWHVKTGGPKEPPA